MAGNVWIDSMLFVEEWGTIFAGIEDEAGGKCVIYATQDQGDTWTLMGDIGVSGTRHAYGMAYDKKHDCLVIGTGEGTDYAQIWKLDNPFV